MWPELRDRGPGGGVVALWTAGGRRKTHAAGHAPASCPAESPQRVRICATPGQPALEAGGRGRLDIGPIDRQTGRRFSGASSPRAELGTRVLLAVLNAPPPHTSGEVSRHSLGQVRVPLPLSLGTHASRLWNPGSSCNTTPSGKAHVGFGGQFQASALVGPGFLRMVEIGLGRTEGAA